MNTFRLYQLTAIILVVLFGLLAIFLFSEVILHIEDYPEDISNLTHNEPKTAPKSDHTYVREEPSSKKDVTGFDVSHYQGDIDWETVSDTIAFVISKATQGLTFKDPEFSHNWDQIKASGMVRGAYHFYVASDDPEGQANFFWQTITSYEASDLPLILDIEEGSIAEEPISDEKLQDDVLYFLEVLERLSGKTPMIYVDVSFANRYLYISEFNRYPLWIAEYTHQSTPQIPSAWSEKGWFFWQRSDSYEDADFDGKVDYDIFNGTEEMLKSFTSQ